MQISEEGATVVAHVGGNLTAGNRRELEQVVAGALARGTRAVAVDLTQAGYVDTAALGSLVMLAMRVRAHGGQLRFRNVDADLRSVLAATRIDTVIPIDPVRDAPNDARLG